jgi:hypothetical protein
MIDICEKLKRFKAPLTNLDYGRGLEVASAVGLLATTYTLLSGGLSLITIPTVILWLLVLVAVGQLYLSNLTSRLVFNLLSSSFWCHLSFTAYCEYGGMNLITAAAAPYTLTMMFVFGALLGKRK